LSDSIGQKNTEYFIWPETAIPEDMDEDRIYTDNYYLQVRGFLNKYKNANVLTGGETHKFYTKRATKTASPMPDQPGIFYDRFSTAINIENSSKVQFYHKSRLVPGAESLPFGNTLSFLKPAFEHLGGATGNYGIQAEPTVLYSQSGIGAAPVICYESIWGEWVSKYVKQGASSSPLSPTMAGGKTPRVKTSTLIMPNCAPLKPAAGYAGRPIPGSRHSSTSAATLYSKVNGGYAPR
jgi:apolipoprotein N-acyltransferase